ncbi:putative holin-like toxin [Bacillus shivajii]|nr:putative holin-like toxin [Bacillus shivajii]UCZ52787.1 putative holin-like toxin [Bacillus shivajii]
MTTYEAFSLIAQFGVVFVAVLTLFTTIVVYINKKK